MKKLWLPVEVIHEEPLNDISTGKKKVAKRKKKNPDNVNFQPNGPLRNRKK